MCFNGVAQLLDADGSYDLIFACDLQELLSQKIIFVSIDELRDVFDDFEDIEFVLFNSLTW